MTTARRALISFALALVVWVLFTWPLPRHMHRAIAYSSQHYHAPPICSMTPGDHLQYLYYLVLVKDMVFGETPLFYNLYEFNTGDDTARYEPDPYYIPFVLVFSLFSPGARDALGWNMLHLLTTWWSLWATWALARRYTDRESIAALAATLSLALPFRWASLLGGSTIGPALMWIPLILLGLDRAVREERLRGGLLAGMSLLMALWTDMHAFFFGALVVPGWCLVALLKRSSFPWREPSAYLRLVKALIPVPLFLAGGIGLRHLHTVHLVAEKTRTWDEAALFSPYLHGLFKLDGGVTGHIFLGYGLILLLIAGLALALMRLIFREGPVEAQREARVYTLLFVGLIGMILLAAGTFGPMGGKLFDLARAHMPFYSNIRQSAKIFCLVPPFIAVMMVLAWNFAAAWPGRWLRMAWFGLAAWLGVACYQHVAIAMTWLDLEQGAYQAVVDDATAHQRRPGAIMVPLWPGDSHYSSVYQMHAVHYRIRMANGYKPMSASQYQREFYAPFSSVNQGVLTDAQIDDLLARGIPYILVHQNIYPEMVSAAPVGRTLVRLMEHPRMEFLGRDERVWAFRLLAQPEPREPFKPDWNLDFSGRRLEAERFAPDPKAVRIEQDAGARGYVALEAGQVVTGQAERIALSLDAVWKVRMRGHGTVRMSEQPGGSVFTRAIGVDAWEWFDLPIAATAPLVESQPRIEVVEGTIDVDLFLLVAGTMPAWTPDVPVVWTAARFFHAGFLDFDDESVTLEAGTDPAAISLYGPKLPLPPGRYQVVIDVSSNAPEGTRLGVINLEEDDFTGRGVAVEVLAGRPAQGVVERRDGLPFQVVFIYDSTADVRIERITMTRLP
ncbi:MAG TPA: hypothetical protein PKC67_05050 [Kiritimatiellia bacterium]|nr:hypothetical protein [Kiritimatiellia bacterium]HMP33700.1 hypothetical protein [Kiritimatiellia bacterium]